LYPVKLGVAGGIIWGVCMFISTLLSVYFGYATDFLHAMSGIYPGYTISLWGSVAGLVYGFLDAFIGLSLLAWLYNRLIG
jgi:hypothetical protein